MKHLLLTLILATSTTVSSFAFKIDGKVCDQSGEPLASASIRILTPKDSTVVKGIVSDANGNFSFPNIKQGRFILEASYVGFSNKYQNISVTKNLDLGTITLSENSIMLKETTVVGVKTAITVKEDTVEFNAESYRTAPNAVVEDLLKRLPGVEVGSDGSITANGKTVKKILVDGKEFFADDPKVASRNLPVNMVDRLQVVDRKSDLARITGVDDGEEETVINLTVKKGMHNGWFGNAEAGYGTDARYKGSFNVNRFWNGNQVTLLGGANNIDELAFTDGGAGRFMRFGGSNGITKSQATGINFNVGKDEKLRVGGNVMWSRSDRDTYQRTNRQYLMGSKSSSFSNSEKVSNNIGNNFRADFRVEWKPDSFNTVDFRPRVSYNYSHSTSLDSSMTHNALDNGLMGGLVNKSLNRQNSEGNSWEFGGELIYNHNFKQRRGRSLSTQIEYQLSNVRERSTDYSWNKFFLLNDSIDLRDQFSDNHTWSNNFTTRITWTEPLGNVKNGNFLTFAYRMRVRWNNADKLTYDHPVTFPDGWDGTPVVGTEEILNTDLSSQFRNDYMNQDIRAGFKHVSKLWNIDAGLSLVPQRSKSIDLINNARNIERTVVNYAPYVRYRLKASKTRSMNLDYNGRTSQPSMTQLQPVPDISNPLNIIVGNPSLDPTFTHNLRMRFSDFKMEAQRSIMLMVMGSAEQNSIVSKTTYDASTGGRTTTYENVNGVWNLRVMNMFSLPLWNKYWTFNNHLMLYYGNNIGFNNGLRNRSGSFNANESFGIAFRPENFEIEFRPRYAIQKVKNTIQTTADRTVHNYGGGFNSTYISPIGITLSTDLNYTASKGYTTGYNQNLWMWNASISYGFMRNRAANLSLKAFDLLRQNQSIRFNPTANYIDQTETNTLGQYCMLTFSYKFNTFSGGSMPENRNASHYGPGGHGGPGGPGRYRP